MAHRPESLLRVAAVGASKPDPEHDDADDERGDEAGASRQHAGVLDLEAKDDALHHVDDAKADDPDPHLDDVVGDGHRCARQEELRVGLGPEEERQVGAQRELQRQRPRDVREEGASKRVDLDQGDAHEYGDLAEDGRRPPLLARDTCASDSPSVCGGVSIDRIVGAIGTNTRKRPMLVYYQQLECEAQDPNSTVADHTTSTILLGWKDELP
ncbi:uncharacterized protein [Miscanthus floridulus]|uniref:uncharacterized protein n=1 Tax=Miscanthus floridulus TaxID=154761 RepID=UPI003458E22F